MVFVFSDGPPSLMVIPASLESHMGFEQLGIENILTFFETGKALTPVNLQWLEPAKL
jgi:hypothetical protein